MMLMCIDELMDAITRRLLLIAEQRITKAASILKHALQSQTVFLSEKDLENTVARMKRTSRSDFVLI